MPTDKIRSGKWDFSQKRFMYLEVEDEDEKTKIDSIAQIKRSV